MKQYYHAWRAAANKCDGMGEKCDEQGSSQRRNSIFLFNPLNFVRFTAEFLNTLLKVS